MAWTTEFRFPTALEAGSLGSVCQNGWVLGKSPIPGLQIVAFFLCPYMAFTQCMYIGKERESTLVTVLIRALIPLWPYLTLITFQRWISKYHHIGALGLQHLNLGGHKHSVHIRAKEHDICSLLEVVPTMYTFKESMLKWPYVNSVSVCIELFFQLFCMFLVRSWGWRMGPWKWLSVFRSEVPNKCELG